MVRREIVLPAAVEEVWVALTRSEELSSWFGADVEIDPRPRGALTARHPDGTIRRGAVLAANRPFRLVILWDGEDGSRVDFALEPAADGTRLTVIETPLDPASPERLLLETAR